MADSVSLRRWFRLRWALLAVFVLGITYVLLVFIAVTRAATDSQSAVGEGDAIVVLGAAQYNGEPSPVLASRLATALELWESGAADQIVTTGANQPGDTFTEGYAGFRFLRDAGVGEDKILVVVDGDNTYNSLQASANQLLPEQPRVLIVTDAYHALRAAETAEELGFEAIVIAAGSDTALRRRLRETIAVSIGKIVSYRRLGAFT